MSLISSLYSGLSGMTNYGNAMSVVGDNLANTNTTGFKSSNVVFSDMLSASTSGHQIGRGNQLAAVSVSQQQGSFQSTQSSTDVAIEGSGYFVVHDNVSRGTGTDYYTRAGNFILNEAGYLVDSQQNYVQGYTYTNGVRSASFSSLDLAGSQSAASPTTSMNMGLNVDAGASAGATFQSAFTAYNSLGENITVSMTFVKQAAAGTWNYGVSSSNGTVSPATASGSIAFNSVGGLVSATPAGGVAGTTDPSISITGFPSGAADLTFPWDLFTGLGVSNGDVTQYAAESSVTTITQDGYTAGALSGLSVDINGNLQGTFTNGQVQNLAQLTLADFASPWQLNRAGNSLWSETQASGQAIIGVGNSAGNGSIVGSSLEMSTTDMATEFTNMIQFQRAYQSSSKIVTTTDQMLQDAINLVR